MKMLCWMHSSDSHGLTLRTPIWLSEGNKPEMDEHRWVRVPALDMNTTTAMNVLEPTITAPRVPKETAWRRSSNDGTGEWFISVGPNPADHVRVWELAGKWYGALVLDGEYYFRIDPQKTDELAKAAIVARLKRELSDILAVLP